MYCMNCGKKLPDDAKVCDSCGMPVGQYRREEEEENPYVSGYSYGTTGESHTSGYDSGPSGYENTDSYGYGNGYGNSYGENAQGAYSYGTEGERPVRSGGVAVAALVLCILAALSCCVPMISIPLSIAGIICGVLGLKSDRRSMAIAALVVSIVFLVLAVAYFIFQMVAVVPYLDSFWEEFGYDYHWDWD